MIWHMCITNMRKRGVRTILTVLGVVIGVISIVCLLSIGLGVKKILLADIEAEGDSTVITVTGTQGKRKERMLTDRTIEKLQELEHVETVYPELSVESGYQYGKFTGYTEIIGIPEEYMAEMELQSGQYPKTSGIKPELLVGSNALDYCYNVTSGLTNVEVYQQQNKENGIAKSTTPDYTNESLTVNFEEGDTLISMKTKITGVSKDASYNIYCNMDVLKKYLRQNTVDGKIFGQPTNSQGENYSEWIYTDAVVKADDAKNVDDLVEEIKDMGFQAQSNKEYVDLVNRVTKIIQFFLGGVGAIALIVAVIGISNTMTTAVYDRIKEIGMLKVLGCDPAELLGMFLLESGILGGIGGIVGILISFLITKVGINIIAVRLLQMDKGTELAQIPWWLAVGSVVFAILLGLIAGFFPAKWAASLKPIEAVRSL